MAYQYDSRYRRRITWVSIGLALGGLLVIGRLFQLQVLQHDRFINSASLEYSRQFTVQPKRGNIYLLDGDTKSPLALNQTLELIYVNPAIINDPGDVAQKLAGVTGDKAADYLDIIRKGGSYQVIKRKVSTEIGDKITALGLDGVGVDAQDYRVYPEGQLAAQVVGFVNADGLGQYGIEGYLDKDLAGTPGLLKIKTDTHGNPIAIANNIEKPAVDGKSYVLTIDRNIQAEAEKALKAGVDSNHAKSGSVVIVDPSTGAVKAMANYPTYDPNSYGSVTDYNIFSNRVVASQFEPGSGFKIFTMAAGLASGKVNKDTHYNDTGEVQIDGRTIKNAENHKFGDQTMVDVIQKSLNTGVIFVLKSLGGDAENINLAGKKVLYDWIKKFGFGLPTGIEQAGEASGTVNQPNNQNGNNVNYANMTFGQGISVTMLQMVMAASAIANGGKLYQPHIVSQIIDAKGKTTDIAPHLVADHLISDATAKDLTYMMEQVVQHGSGYLAKLPGYKVVGKTGTAQIPRADGLGYEENKNIGSFTGFAPGDNPKFAMMVRIDEPQTSGFAESTTVPVFAEIDKWLLQYYQIPPS